jgi:DNA-binding NarL/FixJ family response regulator
MINVIVADGDAGVRKALVELLARAADINIKGEGQDAFDVLQLVKKHRPDIAIVSISLPLSDGSKLTHTILSQSDSTKLLYIFENDAIDYLPATISNGASGFIMKENISLHILEAVKTVYAGGYYLSNDLTTPLLKTYQEIANKVKTQANFINAPVVNLQYALTDREYKIIALVKSGFSNDAIATKLYISYGTVRNYISSILKKVGVKSRTELALFAINNGIAWDDNTAD